MGDVLLIFVGEDADAAEALASACEEAGLSIHDGAPEDGGPYRAALAIWSDAAEASPSFHAAMHGSLATGKALIANLTGAEAPDFMAGAPAFDLADWDGAEDAPVLAPLLAAVQRRVRFADILSDLKTFATDHAPAPVAAREPILELAEAAAPHETAEPEPPVLEEPPLLIAPAEPAHAAEIAPAAPEEAEPTAAAAVEPKPDPMEPVTEIAPIAPAPAPPPPKTPRARPTARRVVRRADHSLHRLSQALLVGATVFALVMLGGALTGALKPAQPGAQQLAEDTALSIAAPTLAENAPAPAMDETAPPAIRQASPRASHRPAPALPPKLARAIAARELERAQWALAQEKLIKDQPQRHAEAGGRASSRALASAALSR
jgi:hypothetical protein